MTNPLIVALDVDSAEAARDVVRKLGAAQSFYKIGVELYAAAGMDYVRELLAGGHRVFLDLKFYDIPETVKRAVSQVAKVGVTFLTVHASVAVMRAAVEGKADAPLKLLGVGVLTSVDDADLRADGIESGVATLVDLRARNAQAAGVDGIVCSALDVARVRRIVGRGMELVTPGVRSATVMKSDQKRVATPLEALRDGADWIVVGREVTRAADPVAAHSSILAGLNRAKIEASHS